MLSNYNSTNNFSWFPPLQINGSLSPGLRLCSQ